MEEYLWFMSLAFFFILLVSKFITQRYYWESNLRKVLPPSPPSIPIIGHLHLLKNKNEPLHLSTNFLRNTVTSYFCDWVFATCSSSLHPLGSKNALQRRTSSLQNCKPSALPAGKHLNYNYISLLWAPYGNYWRTLRRLTTLELFFAKQLTMLMNFRKEDVRVLLKELKEDCGSSARGNWAKVELKPRLKKLSFNVMMKMIAGKRYYGEDGAESADEEARRFRELMKELMVIHGISNLNDFFSKMDPFFQNLIDEHRRMRSDRVGIERKPTLIDIMLSLQQTDPKFYTDETMKGVITSIIRSGTESVSTAVE